MRNFFEKLPEEILSEPEEEPFLRERNEETKEESDSLSSLEEALLKNPKLIEELVQKAHQDLKQYEKNEGEIPERLRPLFLLREFNRGIERGLNETENVSKLDTREEREEIKFKKVLEEEKSAKGNPYLPTLGTEIEIPHYIPDDRLKLFKATEQLGIRKGGDPYWEFAVPFTYGAGAQSKMIHELIRGEFISTTEEENGRKILYRGKEIPLHVNIGVPEGLKDSFRNKKEELKIFIDSVQILTNAFSYAFSSPERIHKNEWENSFFATREDVEKGRKHKKNSVSLEGTVEEFNERLEIRSLEVRDETVYRLLEQIQKLSSALFCSFKEENDTVEFRLKEIWEHFELDTTELIRSHGLTLNALDTKTSKVADAIRETQIQSKMRELITKTSLKIGNVFREVERELTLAT